MTYSTQKPAKKTVPADFRALQHWRHTMGRTRDQGVMLSLADIAANWWTHATASDTQHGNNHRDLYVRDPAPSLTIRGQRS